MFSLDPDAIPSAIDVISMVVNTVMRTISDHGINYELDGLMDIIRGYTSMVRTIKNVNPDKVCEVLGEFCYMQGELVNHYVRYGSFNNALVEGRGTRLDYFDDTNMNYGDDENDSSSSNPHGSTASMSPTLASYITITTAPPSSTAVPSSSTDAMITNESEDGVTVTSNPRPITPEPIVLPLPSELSVLRPRSPISPSTIRLPLPSPTNPYINSSLPTPTYLSGFMGLGIPIPIPISSPVVSSGSGSSSLEVDTEMAIDSSHHTVCDQFMYIDLSNE